MLGVLYPEKYRCSGLSVLYVEDQSDVRRMEAATGTAYLMAGLTQTSRQIVKRCAIIAEQQRQQTAPARIDPSIILLCKSMAVPDDLSAHLSPVTTRVIPRGVNPGSSPTEDVE